MWIHLIFVRLRLRRLRVRSSPPIWIWTFLFSEFIVKPHLIARLCYFLCAQFKSWTVHIKKNEVRTFNLHLKNLLNSTNSFHSNHTVHALLSVIDAKNKVKILSLGDGSCSKLKGHGLKPLAMCVTLPSNISSQLLLGTERPPTYQLKALSE